MAVLCFHRRRLMFYTSASLLVALTGCVMDSAEARRTDPLTGLPKQIPPTQRPVTSTFDPKRQEAAAISAPVSDLGIREPRSATPAANSAALSWSGHESKTAAPTSTPPLHSLVTPAQPTSVSVGGGPRIRSFEEAQQYLVAHGVKWQDLQTTGEGEWKFSCTIPNKKQPNTFRTYEARDRYGLSAIQKVIDQISRDQQVP